MSTSARYYILDGKILVPVQDVRTWARWFEDHTDERRVKLDEVSGIEVSTVFLGIDLAFGLGPAELFETMCFAPRGDQSREDVYCDRVSTWELALEAHERALAWVREHYLRESASMRPIRRLS